MAQAGRQYSPALDGARGVFVVALLAYHFGLSQLAGMWVVINHFFIFSGFLIVRLLVQEYERHGDIDVLGFYRRRIRRLLPALLAVLAFVAVYGALFAEGGQRRRIGGDLLATLGYVMNWRLIAQGDEYFGDQGAASPLQHAWTLAIEEQFYLVVPVLIITLFALAGRRRRRVVVAALVLGCLASVLWTWHLGFPEQADHGRVYYGTDARAQSLFLGAALGAWRAPRRIGPGLWRIPRRGLEVLGVAGLVGSISCFWFVTPFTPWMFSGPGQLLFGLAGAGIVLACADRQRSAVQSFFSFAPFAWAGRRTYGLYLWHWPIFVALSGVVGSGPLLFVLCMVATFVVADLCYRYLEVPVLAKGVRGLLPRTRRPLLLALTPVVVIAVAAFGLVRTAPPPQADVTAESAPSLQSVPDLVEGQPGYRPDAPARIAVHGDSVPYYLVQRLPAETFPGVRVDNLAGEGCDLLDEPISFAAGLRKETEPWCADLKKEWPDTLAANGDEVFVIFASPLTAMPHLVDGERLWLDDPAFRRVITDKLEQLRSQAVGAGVEQVQVVNVPCRVVPDDIPDEIRAGLEDEPEKVAEFKDPKVINRLIDRWADTHDDVEVIDLDGALCTEGFTDEVAGMQLYNDFLHYSPEVTPTLWKWLLGQVSANYADR
ncbi:acyltransferase family protein [Janibacter indicus]